MHSIDRRSFLAALPLALVACSGGASESQASSAQQGAASQLAPLSQEATLVTVHKTPTCGCCNAWIDHLREAGFAVETIDVADTTPVARRLGVPDDLRSCHTAEVDGYAIEGHVPASDIRRLLIERPTAAGLSVPGMPIGSPGMEMGGQRDSYQVMRFDRHGNTAIFASY
ncbi:MAG: DUF411 domain-containing protein [Parasphingopyxis sp.]|uniref:DUF411 domain-containing protein n=1 Tax=Parasphingopyxis sp. TaxID=1920299 RepID=UPI0032EF3BD1